MKRLVSFYTSRVDENAQSPRMQNRRLAPTVRASLINVSGLTFPNCQPASMWNDFSEDETAIVFTFNMRSPFGDFRFAADGSCTATRRPLDEEGDDMLFLEALTYE